MVTVVTTNAKVQIRTTVALGQQAKGEARGKQRPLLKSEGAIVLNKN